MKIVPIDNEEQRLTLLGKSYDFVTGAYNSEISGARCDFIPVGKYRFCLAMSRKHPLAKKRMLSFADLSGEKVLMMRPGTSRINDSIRERIIKEHPEIIIQDVPPNYNMNTFNLPFETGGSCEHSSERRILSPVWHYSP